MDERTTLEGTLPNTRGRRLAGMFWMLDRHRRDHEQAMSLGTADLRILWLFSDNTPRTLKEVAHELGLEQSTVNRQVNAAVAEGLLGRTREPGDSAYRFARTAAGRDAFEADLAISLGGYEVALEAMGEEDASTFLRLMDRYLGAYGAAVPETRGKVPHG
ncbi:MarR family winged helix-turn-helix transcriptional regulator [Brachybacterium sacelli]|uniref:DNA-binding MarR family transcriptional regulator n=1 Tax=Brachybacterium sacelli TaxID=173364 RepID=A0ABS4WW36_9MICO|nr:MarR family winged helix-turn-helix transcriptional regulator [Brachybacterium sacelli]MBP2380356.1 DNA-binding MarR family transcriptional regulator [Brachybacterium sacelli]